MTYYDDERPQVARLKLAAVEAVRNNPESFGEKYFQEQVGGATSRRGNLQGEPPEGAKTRRQLELKIERLERESSSLKVENQRRQMQYDRQTERVEKFKAAYERIRNSPEYAAGRAVRRPLTAPRAIARRLRRAGQMPRSVEIEGTRTAPAPAAMEPPTAVAPDAVPAPPVPTGPPGSAAQPEASVGIELSYEATALRELQRLFFKEGKIREVYAGLSTMTEQARSTPGAESLMKAVTGWASLMDHEPVIPPRQPNPGYFPERGRVLYCAHSTGKFNSNGYSTRTAGLTHALVVAGQDVTVIARPGYPWDAKIQGVAPRVRRTEMRIDSVNHVFNPGLSLVDQPIDEYIASATDVFVREAVRFRAEIMHSASNHVTALPALIAARRLGIPFVYEVRGLWEVTEASTRLGWDQGDRYRTAVHLESLVAREADQVLAITAQVADELIRRGVDPEHISVVPNAADTSRFLPGNPDLKLQKQLGLGVDEQVIGYAGSLVSYEGLEDLLDAFALVKERGGTARLLIVGDGTALPALKSRASGLGLGDAVIFTGRVKSADISRYLSLFSIAPIPRRSIPVTELVSPLKPLEALAAGVPLVLSDVAPLKDIAGAQEQRALLFPAGDVEALADQLERLGADRRLRGDLARRGRRWVAAERSWATIASGVKANYARLGHAPVPEGRRLAGIRLGVIADEFTTRSIEPDCTVVHISPDDWEKQIEGIDALLVESAWEGNNGAWHRMVGYYDDDSSAPLRSLLAACQTASIPTIFWNKEDPVHIKRFLPNATRFDHIFTTDSNCIPTYWQARGATTKTVASLPFFAQPKLHSPLPSERAYSHTVAYGGSYYGSRYAVRSRQLKTLIDGVGANRITIYDRQANNPDSPYAFPPELSGSVHGGLTYAEMNHAYRSHPVHINVNSVNDSPTMFSRRVMEVGASGTPLLTWIGPGISSTLGDCVPTVKNEQQAKLLIDMWLTDEVIRLEDGWRVHRAVYRAHLAAHRLSMILRTAGLSVAAPELPAYGLTVETLDDRAVENIVRQSHYPRFVLTDSPKTGMHARRLAEHGIEVLSTVAGPESGGLPLVDLEPGADRTMAEDLVRSSVIAGGVPIQRQDVDAHIPGAGMLVPGGLAGTGSRIIKDGEESPQAGFVMRRPNRGGPGSAVLADVPRLPAAPKGAATILVAGHDLKFAGSVISQLESGGHRVLIDRWNNHTQHDDQLSRELSSGADVVFCEWALGNVRWHAHNKSPGQRLVTRFHLQELYTPYLSGPVSREVDGFVFVGELIRQAATAKFGLNEAKTIVIPNYVDMSRLSHERSVASPYNIGLVGIVPERKRLDLALDLVSELRKRDPRFRLFVKGKRPEEYDWMASRPSEMAYYEEQYQRIQHDPLLEGAVQFDGHGDDMPDWYARMGAVLSVSDFESFHLTLPDGAAAGAVPLSLAWAGSELIYPGHWLFDTVPEMASDYASLASDPELYAARQREVRGFVKRNFDSKLVLPRLADIILGRSNQPEPTVEPD